MSELIPFHHIEKFFCEKWCAAFRHIILLLDIYPQGVYNCGMEIIWRHLLLLLYAARQNGE